MRGLFKPTVAVHAQCKLYTKIFKKNNHTTFLCWYKCVFNHYERLRGFYIILQPRHLLLDKVI